MPVGVIVIHACIEPDHTAGFRVKVGLDRVRGSRGGKTMLAASTDVDRAQQVQQLGEGAPFDGTGSKGAARRPPLVIGGGQPAAEYDPAFEVRSDTGPS